MERKAQPPSGSPSLSWVSGVTLFFKRSPAPTRHRCPDHRAGFPGHLRGDLAPPDRFCRILRGSTSRSRKAWFYIEIRENLAGTRMSKLQVSDGTTIKPMQDIPSLFIASTQNAEEPVWRGKVNRSFDLLRGQALSGRKVQANACARACGGWRHPGSSRADASARSRPSREDPRSPRRPAPGSIPRSPYRRFPPPSPVR